MPVTAYTGALAALADLKTRLGLTDTSQDDLLQTFINAASRKCESLTNRLLKQRTYTNVLFNGNGRQFFDGDPPLESLGWSLSGNDTIQQSAWGRRLETPLSTITSLSIDGVAQTIGDATTNDVQVIALGRPSGLGDGLYRASGWPMGINNIKMTYPGGFSPVPDDPAEACLIIASAWFIDKDRGYLRVQSLSSQGESIQLDKSAIPTIARELLQSFCRGSVCGI